MGTPSPALLLYKSSLKYWFYPGLVPLIQQAAHRYKYWPQRIMGVKLQFIKKDKYYPV